MTVRLVVAVLLLAVLAGGLWWTASLRPDSDARGSEDRWVTVFVVGPEGVPAGNGTVLSRPTPFDALMALADSQGFSVEVEQQTWIGSGCTATYVAGIAGFGETETGGWNYYTRHPGEAWGWRSEGAACHHLHPDEQVEWCWVESDVCRHHVP
jgi:hypothetical protein